MISPAERAHLEQVTRLIPGYDAWATAGDCWFDHVAAQRACGFFPDCLTHVKGEWRGQPIVLEPWQQGVIANLFGWKRPDGTRRYRSCLLYVPRKNAKTTIAAGIALYLTFLDNEPGAEIYGAAANKDQASICHTLAKEMVKGCPALAKRGKIYKGSIAYEAEGSSYQVISSKGETKHGFNPHGAIIDELHAQKSRDLTEALVTGAGARRQPLTLYTTTADKVGPSICNETHKYASDVRDNLIPDPSFLPVIFEATREDDWTSEAIWRKANPNLGISLKLDFIRSECIKAQSSPALENSFKRLHLNIITEQADRWLQLAKWDACAGDLSYAELEQALEGELCYAGLDLSSTQDLTALGLVFPPTDARPWWGVLVKAWAPKEKAIEREKKNRIPYLTWQQMGLLTLTPGNVVSYKHVKADVIAAAKRYRFALSENGEPSFAYDRYKADHMVSEFQEDGFDAIPFGQGFASMAWPTQKLEDLILAGEIRHGGNPLLRWCASNVAVEIDAAGNKKANRKKSTEKIDPIVATIMGLGLVALIEPELQSDYEHRGLLFT